MILRLFILALTLSCANGELPTVSKGDPRSPTAMEAPASRGASPVQSSAAMESDGGEMTHVHKEAK